MSELDANVIVDGQKTVATISQEGEIIQDGGEIDATCIVEDSNGKRHKAVKIVNIDDEPTDKSEIDAQILNNNNELITVTEEQEGEVIPQDNSEIDFHCLVQKDDGKQLSVKTVELSGDIIKSGGAIDATCVVNAEGKNQLAVKVFKRGGGEIIETVYGTNSITFNAKANGLKALTLFGGAEQSGTLTPTTPQDIISNNGAIKYSANICDVNEQNISLGYYISAQGVVTADANNWIYQKFIPVKPNTTYTLSMSSAVYFVSISEYATAQDSGFIVRKTGGTGSNTQLTITTGATTNFIRFGTNIDRTEITLEEVIAINWMLNEGGTALPYAPYTESGIYIDGTIETIQDSLSNTATAEMLLKVGNYQDTQEVLSGHITRKVGIKVLDGTENWVLATSTNLVQFYTQSTQGIIANNVSIYSTIAPYGCTVANRTSYDFGCFSGGTGNLCFQMKGSATLTTVNAWTTFLADQYNAGTPVIVVYPLATPTTETVAGQHLTTQEGTNRITITQASISNLDLEAKYKKGNGDIDWQVGDRLDNKASFIGYFNSVNPNTQASQRYAVFALDAVYRSLTVKFCGYGSSGNFTPSYSSAANARGAKESATYNTDYMLTNNSNLEYLQGYTSARQATTVSYNGVTYNAQTPNFAEIELIKNSYTTLDTKDPTIIDNPTKTLDAMLTAGIWSSTLNYGSYLSSFYTKKTSNNYARATNNYYGIVPVIEIPVAGV